MYYYQDSCQTCGNSKESINGLDSCGTTDCLSRVSRNGRAVNYNFSTAIHGDRVALGVLTVTVNTAGIVVCDQDRTKELEFDDGITVLVVHGLFLAVFVIEYPRRKRRHQLHLELAAIIQVE